MAKPRINSKPSATVHNSGQLRAQHNENQPASKLRQALKNGADQVRRARKLSN
jgi:hypothetical protein